MFDKTFTHSFPFLIQMPKIMSEEVMGSQEYRNLMKEYESVSAVAREHAWKISFSKQIRLIKQRWGDTPRTKERW